MKPTLITVSYRLQGQIESLPRIELGDAEETATEKACSWFGEHCTRDAGTELHTTEQEITPELLRETYPGRADLVVACGRVCALLAVANFAPAIPEGTKPSEWMREKDAFAGDYEFFAEVMGGFVTRSEYAAFRESYLASLFLESETSDPIEEE